MHFANATTLNLIALFALYLFIFPNHTVNPLDYISSKAEL